jgi:hypothetical protein
MSQDRLINAVSLSIVCEPDVVDGKDCFELALQILGALRDASSGTLKDTIKHLFCFRPVARFSTAFSPRCVSDRPLFFLHLPASGSLTLIECLNFYFRVTQLDAEPPQTQQNFIRSFPRFIFLPPGRSGWTTDYIVKDCSCVTFLVVLAMTGYVFKIENRYPYHWLRSFLTWAISRVIKVIT